VLCQITLLYWTLLAARCTDLQNKDTTRLHLPAPSLCGRREAVFSTKRRLIEYRISLMKIKYLSGIFKVGLPNGSRCLLSQELGWKAGKASVLGSSALRGTALVCFTSAQTVLRLQHLSFWLPSCVLGRYTVSTGKHWKIFRKTVTPLISISSIPWRFTAWHWR